MSLESFLCVSFSHMIEMVYILNKAVYGNIDKYFNV
jgi:hypothetical protein